MILAIDPGKVSGLARWSSGRPDHIESWQSQCWDAVSEVHQLMSGGVTAIVCESYLISAQTLRKTRGLNWSLESIGALRYLCNVFSTPFTLQTPADAKTFIGEGYEKLRQIDWYTSTPGNHAADASSHMLLYLARTEPSTFLRLMNRSEPTFLPLATNA